MTSMRDIEARREASRRYYQKNKEKEKERIYRNHRRRRIEAREFIRQHRTECVVCGESEPCCLDSHHVDGKDTAISRMVQDGILIEKIQEELDKCVTLCSNCHRKVHAGILTMSKITH